MQEQIIGFELAKLAKEKGFRGDTMSRYTTDNNILDEGELMKYPECYCHPEDSVCECGFTYELSHWNRYISAPTQALLQKWLREKHKLIVIVSYQYEPDSTSYSYWIYKENKPLPLNQWIDDLYTYEEALESGLFEALKLI